MALLVLFRHSRASQIAAWSIAALLTPAAAWAQQDAVPPPGTMPNVAALDLAQAETKSAEWNAMAMGLEQQVARMLPCDARVRATIEEVSRASDLRFSALAAYWQDAAAQSQEQVAIARKLLADTDSRLEAWKAERADADREQAYASQQFAELRQSAAKQWTLSEAVNLLGPIAMAKRDAVIRAATRETLAEQLKTSLTDIVRTAEARQSAIEKERQALTGESDRWREYYAVRITRAQTECKLTGATVTVAPKPSPRPSAGKKGK